MALRDIIRDSQRLIDEAKNVNASPKEDENNGEVQKEDTKKLKPAPRVNPVKNSRVKPIILVNQPLPSIPAFPIRQQTVPKPVIVKQDAKRDLSTVNRKITSHRKKFDPFLCNPKNNTRNPAGDLTKLIGVSDGRTKNSRKAGNNVFGGLL